MRMDSATRAKLHGVLLHQPDTFKSIARSDNENNDIIPWFEPTYITPPPFGHINLPVSERTSANIATLIENRWQPNTDNPKQLRFFKVPLSDGIITADDLTIYTNCEANTAYISIDIQDNDSGFITSALPGTTSDENRRLITLPTCATQFTHTTKKRDPDADKLDRFSHAFNFPQLRKRTTTAMTCTTICSTPLDAFILIDAKSLLIPFARTSMLITFSPTRYTRAHSLMTSEEAAAQQRDRNDNCVAPYQPIIVNTKPSNTSCDDLRFVDSILLILTLTRSNQQSPSYKRCERGKLLFIDHAIITFEYLA
jgi:hypothetical protein